MAPTIDIVLPVLNEEKVLPQSIMTLSQFLTANLPHHPWRIVIADNGSTDNTRAVSELLSRQYPEVFYMHIPRRGRGHALRSAWMDSPADLMGYMDIDLSTRLDSFPLLVSAVEEGYDIAIGSRLAEGSKVSRSMRRELISRIYNLMVKCLFFAPFNDAQCGFKVLRRRAVLQLVPLVRNDNWFFDTEMLIIANKRGFHIKEIPVVWMEDPDSRVNVLRTAWEDIKGLMRLRFGGIPQLCPALRTERRDDQS